MNVRLPAPYDFALSAERYRTFGPDPVNLWVDGRLHRVFAGREVRIEAANGGVRIEPGDAAIAAEVRRFLGHDFDLGAFAAVAREDPVLGDIAERLHGFRPILAPDPFEMLVGSITAQQVSLYAALAIRRRLVETYGEPAGTVYAFPTRTRLAAASEDDLTTLGFSRAKARYTLGIARADLDLAGLAALPDDEVRERLTALPGVGEWTADWFLARHLARADAWPAGDLGLRKALARFYLDGRDPSLAEARAFAERFAPQQNLAAQYLLAGMRLVGK